MLAGAAREQDVPSLARALPACPVSLVSLGNDEIIGDHQDHYFLSKGLTRVHSFTHSFIHQMCMKCPAPGHQGECGGQGTCPCCDILARSSRKTIKQINHLVKNDSKS